jgi:hypothetical protein
MVDGSNVTPMSPQGRHCRAAARLAVGDQWHLEASRQGAVDGRFAVRDVSIGGLALAGDASALGQLTSGQLFVGGRCICAMHLSLRHAVSSGHHGFAVTFASAQDQARYHAAVCTAFFPHVAIGSAQTAHIWGLLGRCGFFDLAGRHSEHFRSQRPAFSRFNLALDAAPELGHQLVWRRAGRVEASVAACMPYSATQVLHHLGRVGRGPAARGSLRDVLLCSLDMSGQQPAVQHLAAQLDPNTVFHRQHAVAFAKAHVACGQVALIPAVFYEFSTLCVADAPLAQSLWVRPPTSSDVAAIARCAAQLRGALYAEAFDITAAALPATRIIARWQAAGLERERDMAVVHNAAGLPLAACVLDRASLGSDLFHAFDALTLVPLTDTVTPSQMNAALILLLAYAKNWFLLRGVGQFTYADVAGGFGLRPPPGGISRGNGAIWVVGRPLFAALRDFWQQAFAETPQHKEHHS